MNKYIAPAIVASTALTLGGCAENPDPSTIGEQMDHPADILSIKLGANLRAAPSYTNPDDGRTGLGKDILTLDGNDIAALQDTNDDSSSNSAAVELDNPLRYYFDHNGDWYGIQVSDIITDACSTDKAINPFDEGALGQIEYARTGCKSLTKALKGHNIVWVNYQGASPIEATGSDNP